MSDKPNREELAWAAGFFDGEGSTGCYRNHVKGKRWSVSIQQKGPALLRRFRRAVRGLGHINGPYWNKTTNLWAFRTVRFEHSQAIMAMLWPWLGRQKRQDFMRAAKGIANV